MKVKKLFNVNVNKKNNQAHFQLRRMVMKRKKLKIEDVMDMDLQIPKPNIKKWRAE